MVTSSYRLDLMACCSCRVGKTDAVAKVAMAGTAEAAFLAHEATQYASMLALQGTALASVLGRGRLGSSQVYGIILVKVAKRLDTVKHKDLLTEARQKLQTIHSTGQLHGDITRTSKTAELIQLVGSKRPC